MYDGYMGTYLPHSRRLLFLRQREEGIVIDLGRRKVLADQVVVSEQLVDAVEAELLVWLVGVVGWCGWLVQFV